MKTLIKEFLEENWSAWVSFCEERGDDPEEAIKELDNDLDMFENVSNQ